MSLHQPNNEQRHSNRSNNNHVSGAPNPSKSSKYLGWIWSTVKYLAVFLVIYSVINWWRQPVMPADPDLQLIDLHGQIVDIEQMSHDAPVLVYFWGTWCSVCKVTSPTINSLSESGKYPIVTIATQSGSTHGLDDYLKEHDFTFTTINDKTGAVFSDWQGQVTPSYVILKDGEMKQGLTGIQPGWSLKLRLWLSSLG